jgi:predicted DsbA family dithiol-disulfide isomerase
MTIPIAHDFICPWCWVGLLQAKRLKEEFGAEIEWRGYELFPEALAWPTPAPAAETPANKPATPSRFDFLLHADGLEMPTSVRPQRMRTHNAHEALEYAKTEGKADEFAEALYRAYWEDGREINRPDVLHELARNILSDPDEMLRAVNEKRYAANIVGFDDDAYASGVYNVPTFYIDGERYAEQPYTVLKKAVQTQA